MQHRRIPEWVRHAPAPNLWVFATLTALDAAARGSLISVFPILAYRVFGNPQLVSKAYLLIGVTALIAGLLLPWFTRYVPRRWIFSIGASLYVISAALVVMGGPTASILALLIHTMGAVIVFVALNAYVLDFVASIELGRCETLRMFYSAFAWTAGPVTGVWLLEWWLPAPFVLSGVAGLFLLITFWWLRLGNGKLIHRRSGAPPDLLRYLSRFFQQPRLVAGWLFAVLRSCAWWVYVVYLPIFAVESGLDDSVGGVALSISNALLFATPMMLRWMQRRSVRQAVRTSFSLSGIAFVLAALIAYEAWAAVAMLVTGSVFLVLLDICAGLPFLMAVKPSERVEMSAVYSIYRDVSSVVTPGLAWLVLQAAPLPAVFAAAGAGLLFAWKLAGKLHPRLGVSRSARTGAMSTPGPSAAGDNEPPNEPAPALKAQNLRTSE